MKKNNGFTLMELLIVFGILSLILIIAIISITRLSKSKKEESKENTKEEAENAAEQYFSDNNYLLNDIEGNSWFVTIGTLVENDYLNKVTDPKTGKSVDSCDLILIIKSSKGYVYKYYTKQEAINKGYHIPNSCIMDKPLVVNINTSSSSSDSSPTTTSTRNTTKTKQETTTVTPDTSKPTCNITLSGTKGNKVGSLQWYITKNVTVSMTYNDNIGVTNYGLTTSNNVNYNGKNAGTQSNETKSVTWYGYVKDKAGNTNTCSKTFGLEKSVSLSFNITATNNSTATDSRAKGGLVFNTSKSSSIKPYGNGSGNCNRKSGQAHVGCAVDSGNDKYYFGKACENIGDFVRYFNVSSISGVSTAQWGGNKSTTSGLKHISKTDNSNNYSYSKKQSPQSTFNKSYNAGDLNNKGSRVNFTRHLFSYTSPAGLTTNKISLYTEYSVDCDYK